MRVSLCYILSRMKIKVNKKEIEVIPGTHLDAFLASQGLAGPGYAVALNGKVVPARERAQVELCENDEIIIIKAVCGG